MRGRLALLAALLLSASPAWAADESVLSCVDQRVTDESLNDMMAEVIFEDDWTGMLNQDPPKEIRAIIEACADRSFLPASSRAAYFDYSLNRLIRRAETPALRAAGIKPDEVDHALGLGLGLANPLAAEVTTKAREEQMDAAYNKALAASGMTVDSLLPINITTLIAYTEASARMYRAQVKLP